MSAHESIPLPPVVGELRAIFDALPDDELLAALRGPKRRGRPGYDAIIVWRCYLVRYLLGLESISALVRLLHDNFAIVQVCGIQHPANIPSQPTQSRLGTRLAKRNIRRTFRNVQRLLTRRMFATLPDFGRSVAIDATDLRGWTNPVKRGRRLHHPEKRGYRARPRKVSDPDAGWSVKKNSRGNISYTWGFKAHIICDTQYELPLAVVVSAGNVHDVKRAAPLLQQARRTYGKFYPEYVICDAGYSSDPLRRAIKKQYRAIPIIDPNPAHKKAFGRPKEPEWKEVYDRRGAVERLNGRLKGFFALDHIRVRGSMKVGAHALLSIIALQARALAFPEHLRQCVRAAA